MSKLDDILDTSYKARKVGPGIFSIPTDVKPRIKDLMLELAEELTDTGFALKGEDIIFTKEFNQRIKEL